MPTPLTAYGFELLRNCATRCYEIVIEHKSDVLHRIWEYNSQSVNNANEDVELLNKIHKMLTDVGHSRLLRLYYMILENYVMQQMI